MPNVAVFVDAGYLFKQGSAAIFGRKRSQNELKLNEAAVVAELTDLARAKSSNAALLRVYWYDASRDQKLSIEHRSIAMADHVKLRLGVMNSQNEQKGVDSLIVTDLIELARNRAISDAVLLSGDEDLRIGVQIAQSFGVRIHLLGISPCRGSQSTLLMYEADTTTEWDRITVSKFLSENIRPNFDIKVSREIAVVENTELSSLPENEEAFQTITRQIFASLDLQEIEQLRSYWSEIKSCPQEIDARILRECRSIIDRSLTSDEKKLARRNFKELVFKV